MDTEDCRAASDCSSHIVQKSDFVSLIKFGGVPILPPVLTDAQREEMRCYRHRAGMLDSKLRATARHKKFLQLQMTVQEINEQHFSVPVMKDDLHSLGHESGDQYRGMNVDFNKSAQSASLSPLCREVPLDTASASVHRKLSDNSPTDRTESSYKCDHDKRDQTAVLLDTVSAGEDVNISGGNIFSPSSFGNTVTESDYGAGISSVFAVSHSSPNDSGIYSKAVSNSLIATESIVTESLETSTDAVMSSDDRLFGGSNVLSAPGMLHGNGSNLDSKAQCSIVSETLPLCTELVWSACINADTDDDRGTMADLRSSVMSAGTNDGSSQIIVGTDGNGISRELSLSIVSTEASAQEVEHEVVGQSEVNGEHVSAEQHSLGLSQELLGTTGSDVESDMVLKTVIAVRTKSAICEGNCADLNMKPSELDHDLKHQLQNNSKSIQSAPEAIVDIVDDESTQEPSLFGCSNVDNSISEHGTVQFNADEPMVDNLHVNSAAALEGASVAVDVTNDRNPIDTSPATNDQLSTTRSTELDRYMTEQTDTSFDSQMLDSPRLLTQMASVKILEDEDPRVYFSGRKSRRRTKSFTKANSSIPSSWSFSFEFPDKCETRRHSSCTLGTLQPPSTLVQVGDLGLEQRVREAWQENQSVLDSQKTLTSSMVDLRLRPSKKKLEFESFPPASTQMIFLEPPDEYRDDPILTENLQSFISPGAVDLCPADIRSLSDLNLQAKSDHLQRYLKSLAAMPRCDPVTGNVLDTGGFSQDGKAQSHDVNSYRPFDGEDSIEALPCYERSVSLLMPDLVHRSDDAENLAEDVYLEQQLQQYEVMKQRLMVEHRRSLELLLLEQERQMSQLQHQMMGWTSLGHSSDKTGVKDAHVENCFATAFRSCSEHCNEKLLAVDTHNRESFVNEAARILSSSVVGLHQQTNSSNIDQCLAASSAVNETSTSGHHKTRRSPSQLTAHSNSERFTDSVLDRSKFIDEAKILSQNAVDVDQQKISRSDQSALLVGELLMGHKARSPAGVFYSDQPVVGPGSSTTHSDDAESEFAYESPAVLRQRMPVCSPRDVISRTLLDQSYESSRLSVQAGHLHRSALDHSTILAHQTNRRYVDMFSEPVPADVQKKCEKLSALVKGYLTRRLFRTEKVQSIIKTIWDTAEFALKFQMESPIKKGQYSTHDRFIHERVLAQLNSAIYDFHEIFFDIPAAERMHYIAQERAIEREKRYKSKETSSEKSRRVSAATMKSIERRKKAADAASKLDSGSKLSRAAEKPSRVGSNSAKHSAGKLVRSSRYTTSPRKPAKDQTQRLQKGSKKVVRERLHVAGRSSASSTFRFVSQQNKLPKRNSAGSQTSGSSVVKPLRKIAPGSSSTTTSSATKIPLRRHSSSKLSPAAAADVGGQLVDEQRIAPSHKPTSNCGDNVNNNFVAASQKHSVNHVQSGAAAVVCAAASGSHLTLVNGHKPIVIAFTSA